MIVLTADPLASPLPAQQQAALDLLRALLPTSHEIELHVSELPRFFDCGSNFESVFCPFCEAEVMEWWGDALDRWSKGDQRDLAVATPCCGRETSLNDLDYVAPQGFACVAIELMNPEKDLEPEERRRVEAALGEPVRIVWRHI